MSKIHFWKQFTTIAGQTATLTSCSRYVKDTFLKAIHNNISKKSLTIYVVPDMSKIHFWKQFTTLKIVLFVLLPLFPICQRYIFESNSQLLATFTAKISVVPDMSKIHFWKQFTTYFKNMKEYLQLFPICQRYIFESNSQPRWGSLGKPLGCSRYVKDTFLKAIHNRFVTNFEDVQVVPDMSKIHFWKQFTT